MTKVVLFSDKQIVIFYKMSAFRISVYKQYVLDRKTSMLCRHYLQITRSYLSVLNAYYSITDCTVPLCYCFCGSITDELLTNGALNQCMELVKLNLNRTNISDKGL